MVDKSVATVVTGYSELSSECNIEYIISEGEDNAFISGGSAVVITDRTPFYAESGGQVGDTGVIRTANGVFTVTDTRKTPEGIYLHTGTISEGTIEKGAASASVDPERRAAIARNHSALHLLQAALRRVLGTHVEQAGSYVNDRIGRFDFTHGSAVTAAELQEVEDLVNAQILADIEVTTDIMSPDEARANGAMALFGEKYGDKVRVVSMGDFSKELCGGTHVARTGRLGLFRIASESSVAAGVRRIEVLTGLNTLDELRRTESLLSEIGKVVKSAGREDIINKAEALSEETRRLRKELESMNRKAAFAAVESAYAGAEDVSGLRLVRASFEQLPADALRDAADKIISAHPEAVTLFASVTGEKVVLVSACGTQAVESGAHAGNLLKAVSPIVGGGGGGRPNSASSGGKDASRLPEAMAAASGILASQIK